MRAMCLRGVRGTIRHGSGASARHRKPRNYSGLHVTQATYPQIYPRADAATSLVPKRETPARGPGSRLATARASGPALSHQGQFDGTAKDSVIVTVPRGETLPLAPTPMPWAAKPFQIAH
jgi:hypothetical protein